MNDQTLYLQCLKGKEMNKKILIDGAFKGVVGKVARVAGQQRVVVEVEGVCLVSTAYVPSAFIEKK